jgi:hypothetical protein
MKKNYVFRAETTIEAETIEKAKEIFSNNSFNFAATAKIVDFQLSETEKLLNELKNPFLKEDLKAFLDDNPTITFKVDLQNRKFVGPNILSKNDFPTNTENISYDYSNKRVSDFLADLLILEQLKMIKK